MHSKVKLAIIRSWHSVMLTVFQWRACFHLAGRRFVTSMRTSLLGQTTWAENVYSVQPRPPCPQRLSECILFIVDVMLECLPYKTFFYLNGWPSVMPTSLPTWWWTLPWLWSLWTPGVLPDTQSTLSMCWKPTAAVRRRASWSTDMHWTALLAHKVRLESFSFLSVMVI